VLVALKCDLREDRAVAERLARYGTHQVQYEEGLAVARRIRASRYLGAAPSPFAVPPLTCLAECSAKHNRGVTEVFYESARVSLGTRPKGSDSAACIIA
jgi:Rho family protein